MIVEILGVSLVLILKCTKLLAALNITSNWLAINDIFFQKYKGNLNILSWCLSHQERKFHKLLNWFYLHF